MPLRRIVTPVVLSTALALVVSQPVFATGQPRALAAGPAGTACTGLVVRSGDNIQARIAAAPAGATFCIGAGLYRLTAPLIPKTGDTFIGQPGAVLSGAKDITALFRSSNGTFVAFNQTQHGPRGGVCRSGTACQYPDDVFLDDKPLARVFALSDLGPGKFFQDYANSQIYLAANPVGHRVEAAVAGRAFKSPGIQNVTIRGLTIEKFATPSGGAIQAGPTWVVQECDIRLNHRAAIEGGATVTSTYLHDNGQLGFTAYGSTTLVFSGNEVARNNYAGFSPQWEAGGVKIMKSQNVSLADNYVHDNGGVGMWADWDNYNVIYDHNRVEYNTGPGIFHEASADAIIRSNTVRGNGFDLAYAGWLDGSGIVLNSSRNVEITDNTVEDNRHAIGATQTDRGVGPYGPRIIDNLYVHDNTITSATANLAAGVVTSYSDPDLFSHRARFQENHYVLCAGAKFAWRGYISRDQWLAAGQDTTGTFVTVTCRS